MAVGGIAAVGLFWVTRRQPPPEPTLVAVPKAVQPIIVEPIQPEVAGVSTVASEPQAVETVSSSTPLKLPQAGRDRARRIQKSLLAAGFDPGPVDGKLGALTQKAVRAFQESEGLKVDGKVGPKTWGKLEPYLRARISSEKN